MAPIKTVMGTQVHVPSDPPEDDPPLQRIRAKQPSRPQLEDRFTEVEPVTSAQTPQSRKTSPPGGIKVVRDHKGGWTISMPQVALVAVLTTIGGWFGSKAVSKGEATELADVLAEVRAGRRDLKKLQEKVDDLVEEQRDARSADKKIVSYAEGTFVPIVASLRKLGVKFEFDGADRAADVEFHVPPGPGSTAPPIQPKAVLPAKPNL